MASQSERGTIGHAMQHRNQAFVVITYDDRGFASQMKHTSTLLVQAPSRTIHIFNEELHRLKPMRKTRQRPRQNLRDMIAMNGNGSRVGKPNLEVHVLSPDKRKQGAKHAFNAL